MSKRKITAKDEVDEVDVKEAKEEHRGNASQHNTIFAAWLVNQFGQRYLRYGGGVVDIAGGLGLLSFELSVRYGVNSTVIDPRIVKLKPLLRRKMRKLHKGRSNGTVDQDRSPLMAMLRSDDNLKINDDGFRLDSVTKSIEDEAKDMLPFDSIRTTFPQIEHDNLLLSSSILCGMHSDQATEAIVDAALLKKKPFAVVPCCVFPNLFPDRRYTDTSDASESKKVASYNDFIKYLLQKDSRIKSTFLPFIGRSQVLYMKTEDYM